MRKEFDTSIVFNVNGMYDNWTPPYNSRCSYSQLACEKNNISLKIAYKGYSTSIDISCMSRLRA